MAFSDLSFLFLFFPAAMALQLLMPGWGKQLLMLLLSLVFYAWGSPEFVLLLVLDIAFNYLSALQIRDHLAGGRKSLAKITLISAVAANLLLLGFFKYWGFVVENVCALFGAQVTVDQRSMPIGVSFFTFSVLSMLFDVYREKARVTDPVRFALYVAFFPKLVSGPIVQYAEFESQLRSRKRPKIRYGRACRLFILGLAKKVILSETLGVTFYAISALDAGSLSTLSAWLGAVCYALMLYFDFSGYSDMAIALAELFGFRFGKNFDYPYLSASITEFWRRWHISLGAWFRDYVYIPLGGSRVGLVRNVRNLFVVWLLTGIWHGASWNFVVWGLYYGVLLFLEKYVLKSLLEHVPGVLRHVGTLLLVLIGWVFFFTPDMGAAFTWLGAMFGMAGGGLADSVGCYYLASSWLPVMVSAFAAFPLGAGLGDRISRKGWPGAVLTALWLAALLLLCIAAMMRSTYTSFLYFQF